MAAIFMWCVDWRKLTKSLPYNACLCLGIIWYLIMDDSALYLNINTNSCLDLTYHLQYAYTQSLCCTRIKSYYSLSEHVSINYHINSPFCHCCVRFFSWNVDLNKFCSALWKGTWLLSGCWSDNSQDSFLWFRWIYSIHANSNVFRFFCIWWNSINCFVQFLFQTGGGSLAVFNETVCWRVPIIFIRYRGKYALWEHVCHWMYK